MMAHACNATWDMLAGKSEFQGHPRVHKEVEGQPELYGILLPLNKVYERTDTNMASYSFYCPVEGHEGLRSH